MDPLHFIIAILPLSVYLLLIGLINIAPRPFITSGGRDLAALALAVLGFAIAGPLELFVPVSAAALLGPWVWIPLLSLYGLLVTLAILLLRPRLVIYNIQYDQLRPVLVEVLAELDPSSRWAGDSVFLRDAGIQLAVEARPALLNVSLVAVGPDQNLENWRRLRLRLRESLANIQQKANPYGFTLILLASLLAGTVGYALLTGRQEIAYALREMLRI